MKYSFMCAKYFLHLHFPIQVDDELEIKAYYAGHVLGAAMFLIKVGSQSVVYTVSFCLSIQWYIKGFSEL